MPVDSGPERHAAWTEGGSQATEQERSARGASRLELPKRNNPANELEGRAVLKGCQFLSAQIDQKLEALSMTDSSIERATQALDDLSADAKARELARDREIGPCFYDRGLQLAERGGRQRAS